MRQLLDAQAAGKPPPRSHLQAGTGKVDPNKPYSETALPGHAAWLDWPWKLHRKTYKGRAGYELYDLAKDPGEKKNLAAAQPARVKAMAAALETWQKSVVRSLNGKDYQPLF